MAYDVREIANFILDLAETENGKVSNLSINKIVFFLHAHYLVEFDEPLVTAKIEAWEYGPVFRELYREFKKFGDQPIREKATRLNPITGSREVCDHDLSADKQEFLTRIAKKYIQLRPGELVALSHEKGGAWDQVWNHDTLTNASMKISDEIIKAAYRAALRH